MQLSSFYLAAMLAVLPLFASAQPASALWDLAVQNRSTHRFSTLFTAQDVRQHLSSEEGLVRALDWCKRTGVTKVYIEEFRDGYQAERSAILKAKDRFEQAGIETMGCITPTQVGKPSTASKTTISCYTDLPTQERIQAIFEYAAGLFDEVMIDDFWFTDCACPDCDSARKAQTVRVGSNSYPVSGDRWEDYRCELMVRVSRDRLLAAAKKVNPKVRLIIKYPQWYDQFHERGYEVRRETADFDKIWVGTESRDYKDVRWGRTVPYESYFIMRWLGGIGGEKCGGGWYDWLGTTERTYVEQARQTILGGARESMLFCYGGLQGSTGPKDVEALRAQIPELFSVARQVRTRQATGIAAYKPANSHPEKEARVFDFVGMLGLPLQPCDEFPSKASAAFFSVHALKDPELASKLSAFIKTGRPVLLTDGLARKLEGQVVNLDRPNVQRLNVQGDPKSVLELPVAELDELRGRMLRSWKVQLQAPSWVGLYLWTDGSWVLENFRDEPAQVQWNGAPLELPPRGWKVQWK